MKKVVCLLFGLLIMSSMLPAELTVAAEKNLAEDSKIDFEYKRPNSNESEAILIHYIYGVEVGYQTENGEKKDEEALAFVKEILDYEYFLEKGDKTINPINAAFANARAKAAKKSAMKLLKEEYRTLEINEILELKPKDQKI